MNRYEFHLNITSDQYLDYYRGAALYVIARSTTGENIQFPASLLQRFVTKDGIHGHFELTCNEDNTGASLKRLDG